MALVKCPHCGIETTDRRSDCYYCKKGLSTPPNVESAPPSVSKSTARGSLEAAGSDVQRQETSKAGLWERLRRAHASVANDVSAKMMQQNYVALVDMVLELSPQRELELRRKLVLSATVLRADFDNWSDEGFRRVAKELGDKARDSQHFDRVSAIAYGLLSLWVEAHVLAHPVAHLLKADIDRIIDANS